MPPRKRGPMTIVGEHYAQQQDALFATPEEGAAFIESLTAEQQTCRERRRHLFTIPHSIIVEPASAKGPNGVIRMDKLRFMTRVALCECGAKEEKTTNRYGVVVDKPKVNYSPGYLARGIGRIPKEAIGGIRIQRWVAEALELGGAEVRSDERKAQRAEERQQGRRRTRKAAG